MDDYCNLLGAVGNTCTENTTAPFMGYDSDIFTISRATHDAWLKAVNEHFLASVAFYREPSYYKNGVFIIPEGLYNEKCNPLSNYNAICDLFYNENDGFMAKRIAFQIKKQQIQNSFITNGSPEKLTGIHTYTVNLMGYPLAPDNTVTYTVDYTDYQEPDYNHYLEHRAALGDMLQQLKKVMSALAGHPFTPFVNPPKCSGDIVIGDQTWTQCNLSVTTYRNGDPIPHVEDPVEWAALTTGAWCYYDNNPDTEPAFGKLYNWYAVNDPRGLAPEGYHIPTHTEWQTLVDTVGGNTTAGLALKERGSLERTCATDVNALYWQKANIISPTNSSFFTALPGGRRSGSNFEDLGYYGYWWSSTETNASASSFMHLAYSTNQAYTTSSISKDKGMSVRLVKGEPLPVTCSDVTIGSQIWTGCNLAVTTYSNGDSIPEVTDPIEWSNLTTGAWCYYNNDPSTEPLYGKLYNWYAVNDPRGLAPVGYHIPTDCEVATLSDYLGGDLVAGAAMKEAGTTHWLSPNNATNSSGFTALPAGVLNDAGTFEGIGDTTRWWTSTEISSNEAGSYDVYYTDPTLFRGYYTKNWGHSVRLVKGPALCIDIVIGTQTWTSCNLDVTTYQNGDPIPQVQDPIEWASLTTGAWKYYDNDPANNCSYGKLYNGYAISDPRGIAPAGYHIPTYDEFVTLINYLGGGTVAGGKLKETGTTHWASPNTNATNSSGFTAVGSGAIQFNGVSVGKFTDCNLWSSTSYPYLSNSTWIYHNQLYYMMVGILQDFLLDLLKTKYN
jgi:uncharacterized protein (TIGR02145 family)